MRRFRARDGLSLAFRDEGAGLPVLCLAGLTRNGEDFAPVAAALGGTARVIALDSRGRGASDHAADPKTYRVPVEAADALALLDHLGLERAVVLGTSRGGFLAMTMAAMAPGRLLGVLLNDVGPEVAPEGIADIMAYLGLPPPWRSHAEAAAAWAVSRSQEFPEVDAAGWLPWIRAGFAETPEGLALRYDPRLREAVAAQLGTSPAPDLWPLFDALAGLPLALLRGVNSRLLSPGTAARMRERRPDLVFAEVPGRGHVPFLDEAGSLGAIRTLLDRARSPS